MHATSLYIQQRKSPEFWNTKWSKEGTWLYSFGFGTFCWQWDQNQNQNKVKINKPGQLPEILRLNQMKRCKPVWPYVIVQLEHIWLNNWQPNVVQHDKIQNSTNSGHFLIGQKFWICHLATILCIQLDCSDHFLLFLW